MNINKYLQLRDETKGINRAITRTNICVEALKSRIGDKLDRTELESKYGKELLLILQNYLIQKYYKRYKLITEESYKDERLFFYSYNDHKEIESRVAGILDMNKGKFYLSEYIIKNGDIFSSILRYGNDGFQEIEKQVIDRCVDVSKIEVEPNSEITLTLYQLLTVGNCLGYFDFILSSDELDSTELFFMEEFKKWKFLIKIRNKKFYIDKFNGQLILSCNNIVEFNNWCDYSVATGLKYILSLLKEEEK